MCCHKNTGRVGNHGATKELSRAPLYTAADDQMFLSPPPFVVQAPIEIVGWRVGTGMTRRPTCEGYVGAFVGEN
jgi:hypothetical protein